MDRVELSLLTFLAVVFILFSVTGRANSELSWPSIPPPMSSSSSKVEESNSSAHIHPAGPPGKRQLPRIPLGFPLFNSLYPLKNTRPSSFAGVICEGKFGQFRCLHRKRIKIESAVYGRQKGNVCLSSKLYGRKRNTSCRRDVTTILGDLCDGNAVCYVRPTNAVMGGDPCPHTYKYLSFSARCV